MDMSYVTIHVFGIKRRLFREKKLVYMVTSIERPQNHPMYVMAKNMGYAILFTKGNEGISCFQNATFMPTQEELEGVWDVSFDGSACREGEGVGVWVRLTRVQAVTYCYNISFDCTNNEVEYKAMILAILDLKEL